MLIFMVSLLTDFLGVCIRWSSDGLRLFKRPI